MIESRVTTRGRTTVPPEICEHLSLLPGTRLVWQLMPCGTVSVQVKAAPLPQLAGGPALKKPTCGPATFMIASRT